MKFWICYRRFDSFNRIEMSGPYSSIEDANVANNSLSLLGASILFIEAEAIVP